jgi:hypothetical protein
MKRRPRPAAGFDAGAAMRRGRARDEAARVERWDRGSRCDASAERALLTEALRSTQSVESPRISRAPAGRGGGRARAGDEGRREADNGGRRLEAHATASTAGRSVS